MGTQLAVLAWFPEVSALRLRPMPARSVLASALLGTTRGLSSRTLTALGARFGIPPATSRAALSRMTAAGELTAVDGRYRVAGHLQRRQQRQTLSVTPALRQWNGDWDTWIVRSIGRAAPERVALRRAMRELRYAEHREGVWLRPANLPAGPPGDAGASGDAGPAGDAHRTVLAQAERFSARPSADPAELARSLWDLPAWAHRAEEFRAAMAALRADVWAGADGALAPGFLVLVGVVHHLGTDPLLPPELLPPSWPGPALRAEFTDFEPAWQELVLSWRRTLSQTSDRGAARR